MKILNFLMLLILIPTFSFAQKENEHQSSYTYKVGDVFLGLSSGVDNNMNALRTEATSDFTFDPIKRRYNISFDAGIMATERLRPRVEFQYHRLAYGQWWTGWENSSYTTFEYTKTKVNYFGFNLHLDYLLFGKNSRFKMFISPGLVTELAMGASYKTLKTDGDKSSSKFSGLGTYYPKSIAGGSLQAIFKYHVNENFAFTLTPGYNAYLRKFTDASDSPYQRFNLNVGVELRLH